jgi:predicted nucleotidyltransferase
MPSMHEIQSLADHIARDFNPDRIILFGSQASGTSTPDSDVDMLVVMPFEGRNLDQSVNILVRTDPSFPIDLIARKPDDTARRYLQGDPIICSALDHGKVLYERAG